MYHKLIEYFRSIDGMKFKAGIECNSITANILTITNPNKDNTELNIIKQKLLNCKTIVGVKNVIKDHGNAEKFLKQYGYKQIDSLNILPGDFLVKSRKYFQDVIYKIDATTFISIAPLNPNDKKTTQVIISRNIHITNEHKLWRKTNG